jgi:hypothetical protein
MNWSMPQVVRVSALQEQSPVFKNPVTPKTKTKRNKLKKQFYNIMFL